MAWSLEIEVQFYLLAPLLAVVFAIRPAWLRRAAIVGAVVGVTQLFKVLVRFAPAFAHVGGVGGTLLNHLPMFLMGFLLADVYLTRWRQDPPASLWFDAAVVPGWVLLPFFFLPWSTAHVPRLALPFILLGLCWGSFRSVYVRRVLGHPVVMITGGMCYSIYLLHYPLIRILGNYCPIPLVGTGLGTNIAVYTVLWGLPVLAVSAGFFLLVEKPCMRKDWPVRLLARVRGEPVTPTAAGVIVPSQATTPLPSNQPVP